MPGPPGPIISIREAECHVGYYWTINSVDVSTNMSLSIPHHDVLGNRAIRRAPKLLTITVSLALLGGCAVNNTTSENGISDLMLRGFDPVSYFAQETPVKGKPDFRQAYQHGTYLFSTNANLEKFAANPDKYIPQYGGFCSKGVSYAIRAGGDPLSYAIRDDRLFIFANEYAKDYWQLDPADFVGKADGYWESELKGRSVKLTNLKRFIFRVPHYKTYPEEFADYEKRSGKKAPALPK